MLAAYEKALRQLYTPEVNKLLLDLRQYRDRINRYLGQHHATAEMIQQADTAQVESVLSSCRIDGISVTENRLRELAARNEEPNSLKEREVSGYRFTLNTIDDGYPYIRISTGAISQLHRDMYRYVDAPFAGRWEDIRSVQLRKDELGKFEARLAANLIITKQSLLRDACDNYKDAIASKACDPLVAICMFALDFINIHPYTDGNPRLSRLLTLLLMYQNNYFIGSYESLEAQIERTRLAYMKAVDDCPRIIPEGGNEADAETNYLPFVLYMLEQMLECCKRFEKAHPLDQAPANIVADEDSQAAVSEQPKRGRLDVSREERLIQRAAMLENAMGILSRPVQISKAEEMVRIAEANSAEKVADAKHVADPNEESSGKTEPGRGINMNEEAVRAFFDKLEGQAAKKDVVAACPSMSAKTVERMIQKLLAEGYIEKIGAARATAYQRVR